MPPMVNAAPDLLRGYDHNGNPRTGEIETVLYVYAPDEGRIVDWTQDFDQFAVHDGLTVGVKTVTLRPGKLSRPRCMCWPVLGR